MFLATDNKEESGNNFSTEARTALIELIQNSDFSNDPGIENVFYDLAEALKLSGKDASISRDKLSTTEGKSTENNKFLNYKIGGKLKFRDRAEDKSDFYYGQLGLLDVGKSVKVLSQILILFADNYYFSKNNVNLENSSITVYQRPADGSARQTIYSGNVYEALNRYKFTKQSFDKVITYRDLRTIINREIDFLVKYGLASL